MFLSMSWLIGIIVVDVIQFSSKILSQFNAKL